METNMILLVVASLLVVSCAAAPSAPLALAYPAPAVVTASSSQVVARNYNGLAAAPYVAAPLAAPIAAPYATPYAVPYSTPFAAPYVSPYAAPYAAAAYSAPYLW